MISEINFGAVGWNNTDKILTQASMRHAGGESAAKYVHRCHSKVKSSKGKHPSNRQPPKKKRK